MEWILQRKTSRVQVVSSHVAAYLSPAVLLVLQFGFHRVALVVWWVVRSAYLGAAALLCLVWICILNLIINASHVIYRISFAGSSGLEPVAIQVDGLKGH